MEFKEEILLQDAFADDDSDDDTGEVVPKEPDKEEEVDEFGIDEEETEE